MRYIQKALGVLLISFCAFSTSASGQSPYITKNTTIVNRYLEDYNLGPLSEGIVTVKIDGRYGFYNLNGTRLYKPEWQSTNMEFPYFSSGACIVYDESTHSKVVLYSDRRIQEISPVINKITDFVDDVAVVTERNKDGDNVAYYIDTDFNKIYPHLTETCSPYSSGPYIRPVSCGLRAYFSYAKNAWGYLDANGNVVIEPRFTEVRDFANNHAIVKNKKEDDTYYLSVIDNTGKEVCVINMETSAWEDLPKYDRLSDVSSEGIYMCIPQYNANAEYHSIKSHQKLFEASIGTGFINGHAFIVPLEEKFEKPYVYNNKFEKIGQWKDDYTNVYYGFPPFSAQGLMTLGKKVVLKDDGSETIVMPDGYRHSIYNFSDEGYAKVKSTTKFTVVDSIIVKKIHHRYYIEKKGVRELQRTYTSTRKSYRYKTIETPYVGYCNTDGFVEIAFCERPKHKATTVERDEYKDHIQTKKEPQPEEKEEEESEEEIPEEPKWKEEDDTTGLPVIKIKKTICKIVVHAYPSNGGDPTGSGEYKPGDKIIINPNPKKEIDEEWECVNIVTGISKQGSRPNEFIAVADDTIKVIYRKKRIEPLPVATYRGNITLNGAVDQNWIIPVWLEVSDTKSIMTPYSKDGNYGYLCFSINPSEINRLYVKKTSTGVRIGEANLKLFSAPMRVMGITTDENTGKTYLRVDGGGIQISHIEHEGKNSPMLNILSWINGFEEFELTDGEYRIEIKEGKIGDDKFTFGIMERYSLCKGWIQAGTDDFKNTEEGLLMSMSEKGLPADILNDAVMKLSEDKPDIYWYPTKEFFMIDIDDNLYEKIKAAYLVGYEFFETDVEKQIKLFYNL